MVIFLDFFILSKALSNPNIIKYLTFISQLIDYFFELRHHHVIAIANSNWSMCC